MSVKFSNNGKTTLSSGITSSATSISVVDASVFPTITGNDYFYMTLEDSSNNLEIVKVTSVSSNTLTVVRAQDGTTAAAFSSGDKAENRLTAGGLNDSSGAAALGDSEKATFGNSDDLQIYHDGSNSYIDEAGTGLLYIKSDGLGIKLQSAWQGTMYDVIDVLGPFTTIKSSGVTKLQVDSAGIDVTGTVTADAGSYTTVIGGNSVTFNRDGDNNIIADSGSSANLNLTAGNIIVSSADSYHAFKTGSTPTERLRINASGLDVTGTVTADGLTFGSNNRIQGTGILFVGGSAATAFEVGSGSEKMRLTSTGLGIGTVAPSSNLEIRGSSSNGQVRLGGSASNVYGKLYSDNDGVFVVSADSANLAANSYFGVEVDGTERMRITSSGNLGLGISSPTGGYNNTSALDASGPIVSRGAIGAHQTNAAVFQYNANETAIRSYGATSGSGQITFSTGGGGGADTERARIDSSGNLLVGKSSTSTSVVGAAIYNYGTIGATRDGSHALDLGRNSSDGDIALFRKSGTAIGSIGVISTDNFFISGEAANHAGLAFSSNVLLPMKESAYADAAVDLGVSSYRFKDLHLSGNVNANGLTLKDTGTSSSAGPELDLFRDNSSPADGNYLGQVKFTGKNDAGQTIVYSKITGKTSDVTDGTEDGLIEYAVKKDGSNQIVARLTGSALKLINGTGLEVDGSITATGGIGSSVATTQSAGDSSTKVATTAFVSTAISNLVDSSPSTLNTLNELASALGDDANFSTTVTNSIATKLALAGGTMTGHLDLGDNVLLRLGSSQDLRLYHDGSNSHITDQGTGELRISGSSVALMDSTQGEYLARGTSDGAFTLYHDNSAKLSTASNGVDITGGMNVGTITSTGDLSLATDNATAYFGAGLDLRIYHDGSNSYIKDTGTGDLYIQGEANVRITDGDGNKMFLGQNDGEVQLYYNGYEKLNTTSTGVDVTGTVVADGLIIGGDGVVKGERGTASAPAYSFSDDADTGMFNISNADLGFSVGGTERLRIASGGDITHTGGAFLYTGGGNWNFKHSTASQNITFHTTPSGGSATERMRITHAGNVGIGVANPNVSLVVNGETRVTNLHATNQMFLGPLALGKLHQSGSSWIFDTYTSGAFGERFRIADTGVSVTGNISLGGTTVIDANRRILAADGAANVPYITFAADTNTGLFRPAADTLGFSTGGSERMRLTSTGLGIGTSSPAHKLTVAGGNVVLDNAYGLYFGDGNTGMSGRGSADSDSHVAWRTNGTERMRLDSFGNLGLGVSSPDSKLHVDSGVASSSDWGNIGIISDFPINNVGRIYGSYILQDSESIKGAGVGLAYDGTGYKMHFGTASSTSSGLSTAATIDRSGNVLVSKTASNQATVGHEFLSYGRAVHTVSSTTVQVLNRLNNDGTILALLKDGTSVGSIGTANGDSITIGNSTGNLILYAATVAPSSNSAGGASDGVVSLGTDTRRFKDLRLSSTAYANYVYVGTTDSTPWNNSAGTSADNGIALRADGILSSARAGGTTALFNRTGSIGESVQFLQGGATVGSIGTYSQDSGTNFYIGYENGSYDVGLGFGQAGGTGRAYYPSRANGSGVSSAISLGTSTYKYKDLHLSGYAYVGALKTGQSIESSSNLTFWVANLGEAARIVSGSGHFLVGKTSTALGTAGHTLGRDGYVYHTRAGNIAHLNRTGSDGAHILFMRDGTTKGRIGVVSNDLYIGSGEVSLKFSDSTDSILPRGADGAQRNGVITLGSNSNRFNDLYLSGTAIASSIALGTTSDGGEALNILDGGHTGQGATNTRSLASFAENVSGNASGIWLGSMTNENTAVIGARTASGNIAFQTYNSGWGERMRLTSDGNLLVGQSTNAETGTGIGLVSDGTSHMYSANTDALMLGRGGSDGEILSFNRSGTTVGSIGVSGGNNLYISSTAANHAGLTFATDSVLPTRQGTLTNNITDLGQNGNGFKDLYLSGTANTGGLKVNRTANSADPALIVQGYNNTNGTVQLVPDSNKGSRSSHVHYGSTGDWYIRSASSSGTVHINDNGGETNVGGTFKIGGTTVIDSSRNLTNIGSISSGTITAGNSSTAAQVRAHYSDGSYTDLCGFGLVMNRTASYIRPSTDGDKTLYVGGADDSLDWNTIYFRTTNGLSVLSDAYIPLKITGNNGTYTAMSINNTGNGDATLWLDASNGDLAGGDYASLSQRNNLDLELKTESSAGNILLRSKGTLALTVNGANSTFAGEIDNPQFYTGTNINSSGAGGLAIKNGKRIGFDESGTRSWTVGPLNGNLNVYSGDGNGNFNLSMPLRVSGGSIAITDSNTLLTRGTNNSLRAQTNSGYIDIGPMNTGFCHIQTDRARFYFNRKIVVDSGIVASYDEDIVLRRADNTAHQMTLSTSGATFTGTVTASQFHDGGDSNYYVNPAGTSYVNNIKALSYQASGSSNSFIWKDSGGTTDMRLAPSTDLTVRGNVTAYGDPSDIRLKENVETIPDALEKVNKLDGITFNYKKDGSRSTGLVAQQLQEVLPEVVYETEDLDSDEKHLAVRYGNVVGLLVEAIKEQTNQINELKSEIESLKEKSK